MTSLAEAQVSESASTESVSASLQPDPIVSICDIIISSYVYMDTFCFHPNEFIPIVKSERSVYMNAK